MKEQSLPTKGGRVEPGLHRPSSYASPLVSVLIPAFNAERWIAETIQSVLAQDWPRIEIIVVNDGSRDRTLDAARRFESRKVKVLTQTNRGAAAARNRALSRAQGDYIQWLDADDLLAPDKISRQLGDRGPHDPTVLLSSSFGLFHTRLETAVFSSTSLWQDLTPVDWITTKFANNLWIANSAWLVSRELTDLVGPWNESLSLDDDGEYFCRVVATSQRVVFVPEATSYYRQWNIASVSRATSEQACRSLLTSLTLSIGYLLSLEESPRTREAALSYLQAWASHFYPDSNGLLRELEALAATLGGEVRAPRLKAHYAVIQRLFGWSTAKKFMRFVRAAKLKGRWLRDSARVRLK